MHILTIVVHYNFYISYTPLKNILYLSFLFPENSNQVDTCHFIFVINLVKTLTTQVLQLHAFKKHSNYLHVIHEITCFQKIMTPRKFSENQNKFIQN